MIEINEKFSFEQYINENEKVVAVFSATWCGPCRMLGTVLESIENEMKGISFIKVNVDIATELASDYDIQTLPTVVVIKSGNVVNTKSGFMSNSACKEYIESNFA